jgi:predicted amidohydrolase
MLGRCVAEVADRVEPGRPCVIVGWPLGAEGRKLYAGVALFSDQGTLLAATRQTWIVVLPKA